MLPRVMSRIRGEPIVVTYLGTMSPDRPGGLEVGKAYPGWRVGSISGEDERGRRGILDSHGWLEVDLPSKVDEGLQVFPSAWFRVEGDTP